MIEKINKQPRGLAPGSIVILCGFPKTGKTTAALSFPDPLGLDLENGMEFCTEADRILITSLFEPVRTSASGETEVIPPIERGHLNSEGKSVATYSWIEATDFLRENWDQLNYKTIILDTVDVFTHWINDYTVEVLKELDAAASHPKYQDVVDIGEFDYALGYSRARKKVLAKITEIVDLVKDRAIIVLNVHMKQTIQIREKGGTIPQRLPQLPGELARCLAGMAKLIGLISITEEGKHVCRFDGYGEAFIGSRIKALQGKTVQFKESGPAGLYNQIIKYMKGETS